MKYVNCHMYKEIFIWKLYTIFLLKLYIDIRCVKKVVVVGLQIDSKFNKEMFGMRVYVTFKVETL